VEVRHSSWFNDLAYNFFKNNNIAMVWSQMDMRENEKDVKVGLVAANNHYGGYGPETVDIFRKNMDLESL
jgi:hypothetical protein